MKASLPIFTVIITRVVFNEKYSWKIYFTLLVILIGVAVASVTEVAFDVFGMTSALGATFLFAIIAIMTKKVNEDTKVHALRLLTTLGYFSLVMFLPVWGALDAKAAYLDPIWNGNGNGTGNSNRTFLHLPIRETAVVMIAVNGLCYWVQNILAFMLVTKLSKLSYSVANVTKRLVVIASSILLLKNEVTLLNVAGILITIAGVFAYQKFKLDKRGLPSVKEAAASSNANEKDQGRNFVTMSIKKLGKLAFSQQQKQQQISKEEK